MLAGYCCNLAQCSDAKRHSRCWKIGLSICSGLLPMAVAGLTVNLRLTVVASKLRSHPLMVLILLQQILREVVIQRCKWRILRRKEQP